MLGLLLAINACTKKQESITPSDVSLNSYLAQKRIESQKFTVNANNNNVITGNNGTKVYIGGGTLRTMSGQKVTGNVTFELKEVTTLSGMVLNNAPTVSKGKLLKSGGEFYIAASQNGESLQLASTANYFIQIAAPHGTSDSMQIFTGQDSSGVIAWTPVKTDTVNSNIQTPDTTVNQQPYDSSAYFNYNNSSWGIMNTAYTYMVKSMSFGWINADYFIEMNYANLCEQTVVCDPSLNLDINATHVYYILPSTNSCANLYTTNGGFVFRGGIPNKQSIKIIALSTKNGKCYISVTDHFVNCDDTKTVVLTFKEIAESDIEAELQSINI